MCPPTGVLSAATPIGPNSESGCVRLFGCWERSLRLPSLPSIQVFVLAASAATGYLHAHSSMALQRFATLHLV
jgi:hypothetical protein